MEQMEQIMNTKKEQKYMELTNDLEKVFKEKETPTDTICNKEIIKTQKDGGKQTIYEKKDTVFDEDEVDEIILQIW